MKSMRFALISVLLAFATQTMAQEGVTWKEMHKVKKKETIFGIANEYGLTVEELIKANPEMNTPGYSLKKGDFIFIPFSAAELQQRAGNVQQATQQGTQTISVGQLANATAKQNDVDIRNRAIRVGVMLPLHDVDGDGRRMVEYYRGMLLACDSLKKNGISVDIHAWNVNIDADIRQTLLDPAAAKCDIIFGPLYTKQMKPLSEFVRTYGIKLVIPFSISGNDVQENPNIYQVYQTPNDINDATINQFLERFPAHHPVFIDCNDSTSQKGIFTMGLRRIMDARGISYNVTNLNSSDEAFSKAFSRTEPNIVILNTGRSPELNSTLRRLDRLTSQVGGLSISMFGYTDWLMYTKVYLEYFHKYDTYIPATFYHDPNSAKSISIENQYRRWFKTDMMYALPRFGLTGFDQAYFFLSGLHERGKAFNATKAESRHLPIQTQFNFKRAAKGGGMQNRQLTFVHYAPNHSIVLNNY
ncbi:MAG: LysM peptidoglycan-binding domain-containing protein [Prevotella sp.]|nr:LysM peptidoglycan-binding domain-containing protein [Prevotella sp.]